MGEKSDSKTPSSPYVVLENRPLDQWKVTELKEELKKRKLITRGLKEDLVKRLDEAVRTEINEAKRNLENDLNNEAPSGNATPVPVVADETIDAKNEGLEKDVKEKDGNEGLEKVNEEFVKEKDGNTNVQMEMDMVKGEKTVTEGEGGKSFQVVEEITVKTTVVVTEGKLNEEISGKDSEMAGNNGDLKPEEVPAEVSNQVDEVSKVQSDSISVETISNTEKIELKDNVIADDVKLELDVKPEMVLDDTKSESVEVNEQDNKATEEKDVKHNNNDNVIGGDFKSESVEVDESSLKITDESVDILKKNDDGDVYSSEKLNLDRSSGDDSMEEDVQESKQIDSKFTSNESEKIDVNKEDDSVDAMAVDKNSTPIESVTSTKRKPNDQVTVENNEVPKRRRWNSEGLKVPEQITNHSPLTTPKDTIQTPGKRVFSRSDSKIDQELPKERVVPPSTKTPTTSLRIDNFLRPFTLKAVQELLGKTGTTVSFWMDHIKTHCYVTYSSVEEAIETRNAICNLQWPVNGGRLLMADFVDPQEVKNRVDPPPPPPPPAAIQPPQQPSPRLPLQRPQHLPPPPSAMQPSPRLHTPKQHLPPPPSLPPPPPLPSAREAAVALPPPPPPPLKVDPPIVTLDDLFRKTRATPRIYYLPLTDDQVAQKMKKH